MPAWATLSKNRDREKTKFNVQNPESSREEGIVQSDVAVENYSHQEFSSSLLDCFSAPPQPPEKVACIQAGGRCRHLLSRFLFSPRDVVRTEG